MLLDRLQSQLKLRLSPASDFQKPKRVAARARSEKLQNSANLASASKFDHPNLFLHLPASDETSSEEEPMPSVEHKHPSQQQNNPFQNFLFKARDGTALYQAVDNNHIEVVKKLLEFDVDNVALSIRCPVSPLIKAVQQQHSEMVALILERNPQVINQRYTHD